MTSQSKNFTGYSHFSRNEVFRKLGLTITETETFVEPPKPEPIFEEAVEPATEKISEEPVDKEVQSEPVVEEPQEQPTQEEVTEPEVEDIPEEAKKEVHTPIESLDLKKTWVKILTANGINTVEDLALYLESGKSLTDLPNLSAAAEKSISEKFDQWQNEQNLTK